MASVTSSSRAAKPRSRWWRLHAWLGLKLSLFLSVIFLSGTLATVANEIDWLVDPAMRADDAATTRASWGTIAANALQAVPGGRIDLIERGPDPWFATTVVMRAPDKHRRRVLVDPVTGRVNRVAPFGSVQRFLRDFHRRLMLPVAIGIPLVTSFGFVLLASLVTGLVTYKKFWRGFLRWPRGGNARLTTGDLHRLIGVWSLWFIAVVTVTSLWYLVELLGAGAPELAPIDRAARHAILTQPTGQDLDRLIHRAEQTFPTLHIDRVLYPFPGVTALGVQGHAGTLLTTEKANAVWIEPATGAVRLKVVGAELSAHQRIAEMADPIHFGLWGGLPSKLLWFLFGCFLSGLSVTGVLLYTLRLAPAKGTRLRTAFRGVSYWVIPATALFALALYLAPGILRG